jgi:hypothetical protein
MITTDWQNCYPSNWKGLIVPEAMAHPAKYSSKLIRRIYEHMLEMDWLKPGDRVVDPFGGVALGALNAMQVGLDWYGVELEAKFHGLGNQNIALWNTKFGNMPRWGSAILLNGDSRRLLEILPGSVDAALSSPPYAETRNAASGSANNMDDMRRNYHGDGGYSRVAASVSSPPYADSIQTSDKGSGIDYAKGKDGSMRKTAAREAIATGYGAASGQLGAMKAEGFDAAISSPPFLATQGGTGEKAIPSNYANDPGFMARHAAGNKAANAYGSTEGQLSSMRDANFDAAISSPPFLNETNGGGLNVNKPATFRGVLKDGSLSMGESGGNLSAMKSDSFDAAVSSPPYNPPMSQEHNGKRGGQCGTTPSEPGAFVKYGNTDGQLEGMSMEGFDAAISSPPYEGEVVRARSSHLEAARMERKGYQPKGTAGLTRGVLVQEKYGDSAGQLGNDSGNDFWTAARTIVEQVYLALTPGGHAVWVVKDYVKNKQIVPFSDQWRQLCEAVGFATEHEHHAMLVHHKGSQHTLDGGMVERKTESKSFFRRLAEKKGSPRIDYETVFCMEKPS